MATPSHRLVREHRYGARCTAQSTDVGMHTDRPLSQLVRMRGDALKMKMDFERDTRAGLAEVRSQRQRLARDRGA